MNLSKLEKNLQYNFINKKLLNEALTHPSKKVDNINIKTYQRLEFLGDKVLNFIIAQELFLRFPKENEGEISRRHSYLVSGDACVEIATKLDIFPYIYFSSGQKEVAKINKIKIIEDTLEAIIGAIYLDSDMMNTQKLVIIHWNDLFEKDQSPPKDSKSALQEYYQKHYKIIPQYTVQEENKIFIASLKYKDEIFIAEALTKKEAEKNVAQKILDTISTHSSTG